MILMQQCLLMILLTFVFDENHFNINENLNDIQK